MTYNEALAQSVRDALAGTKGLAEKKMFGGIAFMIGKTMCIGVDKMLWGERRGVCDYRRGSKPTDGAPDAKTEAD